jgi:hypothetical protein
MTRLRTALRLLRCALFHDLRQRQGAWRCWTCHPIRHHTARSLAEYHEAVAEEARKEAPDA